MLGSPVSGKKNFVFHKIADENPSDMDEQTRTVERKGKNERKRLKRLNFKL